MADRVVRVSRIRYVGRECREVEIYSSGRIRLVRSVDGDAEYPYAYVVFQRGRFVVTFYDGSGKTVLGVLEGVDGTIHVRFHEEAERVPQEVKGDGMVPQ